MITQTRIWPRLRVAVVSSTRRGAAEISRSLPDSWSVLRDGSAEPADAIVVFIESDRSGALGELLDSGRSDGPPMILVAPPIASSLRAAMRYLFVALCLWPDEADEIAAAVSRVALSAPHATLREAISRRGQLPIVVGRALQLVVTRSHLGERPPFRTVIELCCYTGCSPPYLRRHGSAIALPPGALVRWALVLRGLAERRHTSLAWDRVARRIGVPPASAWSKVVRRTTGTTPSEALALSPAAIEKRMAKHLPGVRWRA
jgi:hypothetical protein